MNRRSFLAGGAVASIAGSACRRQTSSSYRTLTDAEALTLAALCDQIIPPDQDPGAAWAGAVAFIDIQLKRHYKKFREAYRAGLARTDQVAAAKFRGRGFAALNAAEQLACAQDLEKTEKDFFNMVVAHTMQAYYGSPRHGGNREYASWRMLRIPVVPARGRNQYDLTRVSGTEAPPELKLAPQGGRS